MVPDMMLAIPYLSVGCFCHYKAILPDRASTPVKLYHDGKSRAMLRFLRAYKKYYENDRF